MMPAGSGEPMTCDEAALALMMGSDEVAVARAQRHRAACELCGIAEQAEVPEELTAALPRPPPSLLATLIALGAMQLLVAIPWIVGSDPFGLLGTAAPPTHTTRDGAVGIVIAAAAIFTGIQPRWARPAFYISATVVVAQAVAGVVDKSIVETGLPEVIHLLGVGLTGLIAVCIIYQILDPLGPERRPPLRGVDPQG
jgi:hypothetical protein